MSDMYYKVDECWEYYAKWNKYYRILPTWGIWSTQIHRQKVEWWLPEATERGSGKLFNGHSISVLQDERSPADGWWWWMHNCECS
jgi:hypothetical protein